jgi:predicted NBD/HSP70 family sugar kinase
VVAALDIGGTHVSAARVEPATGTVEQHVRVEYEPDADRQRLLGAMLGAASSVCVPAVESVGVSAPGPFDYENGVCTIRGVGKLEALYGVDLRDELSRACGVRADAVVFLNDAEAFLLGEARHGAARGHDRAIGVTLGTGLGSAFLAGGAIVRRGTGVPPDGSLHLLEFRGAPVEERISARALRARAGSGLDVRELAQAARTGDPAARRAFDGYAGELAEFLEPVVSAFAPTCIVVGGSISRAWDLLGTALEHAFAGVEVARAQRLDDAALLGAALRTTGSGRSR